MRKKSIVCSKASKLFDELLETYFNEYSNLSVAKIKKLRSKYKPNELFLEDYSYDG